MPLAIDELPLVGAARLLRRGRDGRPRRQELRVKESDRIAAVVDGLAASAATSRRPPDGFVVRGTGGLRGGVSTRAATTALAMLGAIAGLASREGVEVVGMEAAAVSYPGFTADLERACRHDARAYGSRCWRPCCSCSSSCSASCASSRRTRWSPGSSRSGTGARPCTRSISALLGCILVPGPLLAAVSGVLFGTWLGFAVTLDLVGARGDRSGGRSAAGRARSRGRTERSSSAAGCGPSSSSGCCRASRTHR